MFKRVAKRAKRKEKEEALGLDEEMKEALGMHETDSEESDSSEDGSGSDSGRDDMSRESLGAEDDEVLLGSEDDDVEKVDPSAELDDESTADLPMNLDEALRDPIYLVSWDPEVKACIVCPGKLLKNSKMSDVHVNSNAHKRRFAKFVTVSRDQDNIADALDALTAESAANSLTDSHPTSKRAQKRKAKMDAVKAKRALQKVMKMKAFEKKAAKAASGDLPSPSKPLASSGEIKSTQDADVTSPASSVEIKNQKRPKTTSKPVTADPSSPVAKKRRKNVTDSVSFSANDGTTASTLKTVDGRAEKRTHRSAGKTALTDKPRKKKLSSKSSGVGGTSLGLLMKRKTTS